ncbi:unnamed protein product [Victoria cruziana]
MDKLAFDSNCLASQDLSLGASLYYGLVKG